METRQADLCKTEGIQGSREQKSRLKNCKEVKMEKQQLLAILGFVLFFGIIGANFVAAAGGVVDNPPTDADKAKFDQVLQPVFMVYNLVKYIASAVAALFLLFAGMTYMTSGSDPGKRERAKNMAMYVIIGLIVIWAAPIVVTLFVR